MASGSIGYVIKLTLKGSRFFMGGGRIFPDNHTAQLKYPSFTNAIQRRNFRRQFRKQSNATHQVP